MKKWCTAVLTVLIFGLYICGCGSKKTVLKWAVFDGDIEKEKYQEAVNEKLREKGIDCEIEFVCIPSDYDGHYGEYVEPYWSALEEGDYDLAGGMATISYLDMYQVAAGKGLLLPLDSMLEERETGKKLKEAYPANVWESMKVDGDIYGVLTPMLQFHYYLVFNQEFAEKYHLDLDQVSEDDLEDYLRTALAGEEAEGNRGFVPIDLFPYPPGRGYEYSNCMFIEFDVSGDRPVPKNILYEETYLNRIQRLTDWQKEGLLKTESGPAIVSGNFLAMTVYSYSPEAAECAAAWKTEGSVRLRPVGLPKFDTMNFIGGSKAGIVASSRHKEEAFDVLAAIYSDPELSNALVYGKEGKDYELADGKVVRPDNITGSYMTMRFGNPLLTLPEQNEPSDKCQDLYEIVSKLPVSKLAGWSFDFSGVETELNQLNNYYASHNDFFWGASSDWGQELEELRKTAEELGIDRVLEEMNAQLADWEGR